MTHCASAKRAPNSFCSAGSATLTTVPSMNAMLEARMVAASTQGAAAGEHGTAPGIFTTTTSFNSNTRVAHDLRPSRGVRLDGFGELLGRTAGGFGAEGGEAL